MGRHVWHQIVGGEQAEFGWMWKEGVEQEETETNSRDLRLPPLRQTKPSLLPRSGLPFFIPPREFWKERLPSSLKAGDVR